ncbi:MAG: Mrp/NBP35 family ATP-binding protein [Hyphomonadaceae bacterium]|nr:Mrp/NBP35 family ATP-binding protein [Hyphomonadaceae bacterium]
MNNGLTISEEALIAALDRIQDPVTGRGLAAAGRIAGIAIRPDGALAFTLEAPAEAVARYKTVRDAAEATAAALPGVSRASVVLTAHRSAAAAPGRGRLPGVGAAIAVASAKGGVGKSTIAVNLACALAATGRQVGLLDLDIYGPSVPTLLGAAGLKPTRGDGKTLNPIPAWGLKTLSIGNIVDPDQAMIWRGPMASGAARQLLEDAAWAPLDVLVLDLPPGTGDLHLTLLQRLALDGVVLVSTPQEVALADVRRGAAMFEKMHAPILGVIENMSWYEAADGARAYIFGEGGARRTAEAIGAPFLGELPLDMDLRVSADAGAPLVASQPEHPMARRFAAIAARVLDGIAVGAKPLPEIRFA